MINNGDLTPKYYVSSKDGWWLCCRLLIYLTVYLSCWWATYPAWKRKSLLSSTGVAVYGYDEQNGAVTPGVLFRTLHFSYRDLWTWICLYSMYTDITLVICFPLSSSPCLIYFVWFSDEWDESFLHQNMSCFLWKTYIILCHCKKNCALVNALGKNK